METVSPFIEVLEEIKESGGDIYRLCYQCGKCSSGCPSANRMDHIPSQFIKLLQLGMEEKIKNSNTPWVCLTCFICSVRCPKGIDIARIMEAGRLLQSRKNEDRFNVRSLGEILEEKLREEKLPPIAVVSCFRKHTAS